LKTHFEINNDYKRKYPAFLGFGKQIFFCFSLLGLKTHFEINNDYKRKYPAKMGFL
tara:strand:- start:42 stop:209 length:168 start_codon:yes stop_codon:yes gene_type:complete